MQLSVVALRILETTLQSWSVVALWSAAQRCSVGALLRSGFAFSCFCVGGDAFLQDFPPSPPCGWGCLPSGFLPLSSLWCGDAFLQDFSPSLGMPSFRISPPLPPVVGDAFLQDFPILSPLWLGMPSFRISPSPSLPSWSGQWHSSAALRCGPGSPTLQRCMVVALCVSLQRCRVAKL